MLIQILSFFAVLIIPLGLLITIGWTYRRKNRRKSRISNEDKQADFDPIELRKIRRNSLILGISSLAIFPFLLLLYQLIHGPNVNPYLFIAGYLSCSLCIGIIIAINYLQILNDRLLVSGISNLDISITITGLLSTSLYIAWIAAALMELIGSAWRGNVMWENIMDGLFGILVGTFCIILIRTSILKLEGRSLYILFALLAASLISWIISSAKAGMPLYLNIPEIMRFPENYLVRGEHVVIKLTFLLQAILCQILMPLTLILFLVRSIKKKTAT